MTADSVEVLPADTTASPTLTVSHYAQANACSIPTSPLSPIYPAQAEVLLAQADTIPIHTPIVLHLAQADANFTSLPTNPLSATTPAQAEVLSVQADTISTHTHTVLHYAQANAIHFVADSSLVFGSLTAEVLLVVQADT